MKKEGTCPGGLSDDEWNAVVDATKDMDDELGGEILNLLNAGMIVGCNCAGDVFGSVNSSTLTISLNRTMNDLGFEGSVFGHRRELTFTLGHENGHRHQYLEDRLVPAIWLRRPDIFERQLEGDANDYASSHLKRP